jgi:hypothetical protein
VIPRAAWPAVVLVVVASVQIGLASQADLTPWKGGGFGMFSTLDHGAFRSVEIVIDGPDRSETLDLPPSLERIAARAAGFPAERLLRALAVDVVARERRYGRAVDRVTLTVWRTSFEPDTLMAREVALRRFVYAVP